MKSLLLGIILSSVLLFHIASAMPMGNLVVSVTPEKNTLESSDIPVILGTVTDQASKPITGAKVNISTSYGTIVVVTDAEGKFRYQYTEPISPSQYVVNVKAQKDGYGIGLAKTTFFVKGIPVSKPQNFQTLSGDKINQDPISSKILKSMETAQKRQAAQEEKIKKIEADKKFIEEQRVLANQDLQNDLQGWIQQFDPFTPRNAYASFVSEVNQTVQSIFWGQFNFTDQKINDGHVAQSQVLQNGGSNGDARKAFIQKATSTRNEIIKVNDDLNVKYGHANKDVQSKFDSVGKLPRYHK
jgi:hypothetical protein